MSGERDVVGLQRHWIASHDRRKRGVHKRLQLGHAAKARGQMQQARAAILEAPADILIDANVGAAEAIDRLLRIADEEQTAGHRARLAPIRFSRIVSSQQQEDLSLQRIGVLELVDKNARKPALKSLADLLVVANQISRDQQQVEEVEGPTLGLHLRVALERAAKLELQQGREVGVG